MFGNQRLICHTHNEQHEQVGVNEYPFQGHWLNYDQLEHDS